MCLYIYIFVYRHLHLEKYSWWGWGGGSAGPRPIPTWKTRSMEVQLGFNGHKFKSDLMLNMHGVGRVQK